MTRCPCLRQNLSPGFRRPWITHRRVVYTVLVLGLVCLRSNIQPPSSKRLRATPACKLWESLYKKGAALRCAPHRNNAFVCSLADESLSLGREVETPVNFARRFQEPPTHPPESRKQPQPPPPDDGPLSGPRFRRLAGADRVFREGRGAAAGPGRPMVFFTHLRRTSGTTLEVRLGDGGGAGYVAEMVRTVLKGAWEGLGGCWIMRAGGILHREECTPLNI
jgi:hypothetical protein